MAHKPLELIARGSSTRTEAVPVVREAHPLAQVTQEAAIGSIDQTQLETLMAHGLTPDQAIDLVIGGLPRPQWESDE
ncbi:hypothetical protein Thiowin_03843 [Thiorhodovibrio winogradskyi]|uniref:Uncharacterized protein n=1 Tax=Thiorhodovibrio winogradskyi TaxID=77007 RepID=A0ABZ0SDQ3_9GAMM|nr:SufD family Fe-S cluster assembly protein [Thiorhodovibrio winogradskyi]